MIQLLAGRLAASSLSGKDKPQPNISMNVKLDDKQVRRLLKNAPKQIKFATATALNKTAKHVQSAEVKELHRVFNIRSKWWKPQRKYGVRVKKAVKSRLHAEVFTNAHWLLDHVKGATRIPQHLHRAVPKSDRIKRKGSGQISKSWLPANVKNKFVVNLRSGNALMFKYNKVSREKELMYLLIPKARIKRNFDWYGVGNKTAKKVWDKNMRRAVKYALETAK